MNWTLAILLIALCVVLADGIGVWCALRDGKRRDAEFERLFPAERRQP